MPACELSVFNHIPPVTYGSESLVFISWHDDIPSIFQVHLPISTKSQNMIGRVAIISKSSKKKKRKEKQIDSLTSLTVTLNLILNCLVS